MGVIPPEPPVPPDPGLPPPGVRPPPPPPPLPGELPPGTQPALDIAAVLAPLASANTAPQRKTPMLWKRLWFTLGIDVPDSLKKSARHRRGIRNVGT